MELDSLIAAFVAGGVQLRVEEGVLRWRARVGVMTAELRAALETHRAELTRRVAALPARVADWPAEIREVYEERAGFCEYVAGMARGEAEATAEMLVRLRGTPDRDGAQGDTGLIAESSLRARTTTLAGGSGSIR